MTVQSRGDSLHVEIIESAALDASRRAEILALCRDAYREPLDRYLEDIGAGVHLLVQVDHVIVSHGMVVPRWLQLAHGQPLRTAYIELVATRPGAQRRGYATALMRRLAEEIISYDIGALSPTDEKFYAHLGWESWRGPLFVRTGSEVVPAGDEGLMVLRLPRTPAGLSLDEPISIEWRPGEVW